MKNIKSVLILKICVPITFAFPLHPYSFQSVFIAFSPKSFLYHNYSFCTTSPMRSSAVSTFAVS